MRLPYLILGLVPCFLGTLSSQADAEGEQPNILFIICDDLNDIDITPSHTPNLDKLLAVSTEFRGYPNFPWCNASRSSLLCGLRPEATGIYSNTARVQDLVPNRYWLPQGINDAGYHTVGVGKIPHQGAPTYNVPGWDAFYYPNNWDPALDLGTVFPYQDTFDVAYWDDGIQLRDEPYRDKALELIAEAKLQSDPWFVGVGFKKPHGPWYSHRSDWTVNGFLHPDGSINLDAIPTGEIVREDDIKRYPTFPIFTAAGSIEDAKTLRMAYRACITHIDGLVGDVLAEVDTDANDPALNLPDDLIVVFTSDHGYGTYQLNRRVVEKLHPHEAGNRMPLWIHMPGQAAHEDRRDTIVEFIDLYPTLLDFAGNSRLKAGTLMTHGQSLKPHLLSGDWSGWNNWAATLIVNSTQAKRWKRIVTPEYTSYHQLWNNNATLFSNQDNHYTQPSGNMVFFPADPEHWCNITINPNDALIKALHQFYPAAPLPQALSVGVTQENSTTVSFFAEQGLRYTISGSADLENWQELEIVDGTGAEVVKSYQHAGPQRFYRVNLWLDPVADFSFMK